MQNKYFEIILYQTENGQTKLEVRFENGLHEKSTYINRKNE